MDLVIHTQVTEKTSLLEDHLHKAQAILLNNQSLDTVQLKDV